MENNHQVLDILACQIDIPTTLTETQRDSHLLNTAIKLKKQLTEEHYDMVVLPELSSIDYSVETFDCLTQIAEPLDGRSYKIFSELAIEFGVYIVYGIARLDDNGCYISQVVIDSMGRLVGHFDKLHIANFGFSSEKKYFKSGKNLLIFELKGIKIAPIICYDIRIPELTRTLALEHDVQLILHCGAYGRDQSFYTWHDFVITRALENQLYILSLNRAGEAFGNSFFCPPWVDEVTPGIKFPEFKESLQSLKIDVETINQVKTQYSFLTDKHDDYSLLKNSAIVD